MKFKALGILGLMLSLITSNFALAGTESVGLNCKVISVELDLGARALIRANRDLQVSYQVGDVVQGSLTYLKQGRACIYSLQLTQPVLLSESANGNRSEKGGALTNERVNATKMSAACESDNLQSFYYGFISNFQSARVNNVNNVLTIKAKYGLLNQFLGTSVYMTQKISATLECRFKAKTPRTL